MVARRPRRSRSIAAFLHELFPDLAARVAAELIARADLLGRHPRLGRRIAGRDEYREVILQALGGTYVLQYRYDGRTILMLRAFPPRDEAMNRARRDMRRA